MFPAVEQAGFASSLDFDDIPEQVREAAKRSLLDILGVAIHGRAHPVAKSGLAGARSLSEGEGRSVVWGSGEMLQLGAAIIANGISAHVDDFDDTHSDGIVHGSAVIAPLAVGLAAACGASGKELLAAYVAGWEIAARVGLASKGTFHKRGFHTTSIAGVFGATAAACRLLRLTSEQTAHALGLAASQASGINEYLSNGSSAKTLHCGWSAYAGLVAARMAHGGMTGPQSVFEGRDGLLRAYGLPEFCNPAALTRDLGTKWQMSEVSIKPYPCCHFAHAFVDCAASLMARGVTADQIEGIECVVHELQAPMICEPRSDKLTPANPYIAKFSLPYLVAARMVQGRPTSHETFSDSNLARSDILSLARRVTHRIAAPGETRFPQTFPGKLTATLHDGTRIEERLDANLGHPENPLSFEDIVAKFRSNASDVLNPSGVDQVVNLVRAIEATDARTLAESLGAH